MHHLNEHPLNERRGNERTALPDFNALLDLARTDPPALERLRERLTNDIIRRARSPRLRRRLRGLKFRIDMERRRSRDPMDACMRISTMMHRSLADLKHALEAPESYLEGRQRSVGKLLIFPPLRN